MIDNAESMSNYKSSGITLVELLLVISIIIVFGTGVSAFGTGFFARNNFRNTTNILTTNLRLAQLNSMSSKEGRQWGIDVAGGQIRLYAQGDSSFDITFDIPSNVSVSSGNVLFSNLSGEADSPIVFDISNSVGDSRSVSVNELGIVDLN